MSGYNNTKMLLIVVFMTLSNGAFAVDCNKQSPAFALDGDDYFNISKSVPLSRQQESNISSLISAFTGKRLEGEGVITECFGTQRNPRKVVKHEDIQSADIQLSNGELVIHLESVNKKQNTSHSETIRYFNKNDQYRIVELTKNTLRVNSKYRTQAGSGSVINEAIVEISARNTSLVIKLTRYVNGYFAVEHTRKLHI
jgi:hypothetical protein